MINCFHPLIVYFQENMHYVITKVQFGVRREEVRVVYQPYIQFIHQNTRQKLDNLLYEVRFTT